MSQVIVTHDNLDAKRAASRKQEDAISREAQFDRWRRNDITGKDPVASLIGYALMPIIALWGLVCGAMVLMLTLVKYVFQAIGRLLGGKKSLINGDKV